MLSTAYGHYQDVTAEGQQPTKTRCERNNKTAYLLFGHAGIVLCKAMLCKAWQHWAVIVEQTFMGGIQLY